MAAAGVDLKDPTHSSSISSTGGEGAETGNHSSGSSGFKIPNIPIWTRWAVESILYLALPFYKRALQIEGVVASVGETAAEDVIKVAAVVEKVASEIVDALPRDSIVENDFVLVEHWAEVVMEDARKAEAIIQKVDAITKKVDERVEPIIAKLEAMQIAGPGIVM